MNPKKLYLTPDYYPDFRCKMGACRTQCCYGWPISVSQSDYFKLLGMDCPPDLRYRLDTALHIALRPTPEQYARLEPRWDGQCGLRTPDGLCALHADLGPEYLPEVCRLYPRTIRETEACCANSCEALPEYLFDRIEPIGFICTPIDEIPPVSGSVHQEADLGIIRVMQDRTIPIAARLRKLAGYTEAYYRPGDFRALLEVFGEHSDAIRPYAEEILTKFTEEDYPELRARFETRYPQWETGFENLIVNHMFFACFPHPDDRVSPEAAYRSLCVAYGLVKVLTVSWTALHEGREALADVIAAAFRLIEHTAFHYNCGILYPDDTSSYTAL